MKYVLACLAIILLFSCKKDAVSPVKNPAEPVKRRIGAPLAGSQPVSKTIGPNGGTIFGPEDVISVKIPAGALETATVITIQEVQTVLEGTTSRSFRLGPEGVNFKKPVEIRFSYQGMDLRGTTRNYLRLAYQDAEGYFHKAAGAKFNETAPVIYVQSTHFSDWTVFEMYKLYSPWQVDIGGEAELYVRQYGMRTPSDEFDEGLGEYMDEVNRDLITDISWSLAGAGVLESEGSYATYFAPGELPDQNPVTVSVALTGDMLGTGTEQKVILFQPIAIVGSEYFNVTLDGVTYTATDPVYVKAGNQLIVTAIVAGTYQLNIIVNTQAPGVFPCNFNMQPGRASISLVNIDNPQEYYESSRGGCVEGDEMFYHSPGPVRLVSFPNRPGEFAEGSVFAGKLWTGGNYCANPKMKTFEVEFRVL